MSETTEKMLWILTEIFILILLMAGQIAWIHSLLEDTKYERNYLNRDMALLIGTLYSAPGNVDYLYTTERTNISKFAFTFSKQRIVSNDAGMENPVYYWYADDLKEKSVIQGQFEKPSEIPFCYVAGVVKLGRVNCSHIRLNKCPEVDTKKEGVPLIMLDPVFGGDEKGKISEDGVLTEAEASRAILFSFKNYGLSASSFTFDSTRDLQYDLAAGTTLPISDRIDMANSKTYDLLITLTVGESAKDRNPVNIYVPKEHSLANEKLACMLGNAFIINNNEVTSISPIIVNPDNELLNAKPHVAIEIQLGNINNPHSSLLTDQAAVGKVINDVLKQYYGVNDG